MFKLTNLKRNLQWKKYLKKEKCNSDVSFETTENRLSVDWYDQAKYIYDFIICMSHIQIGLLCVTSSVWQ